MMFTGAFQLDGVAGPLMGTLAILESITAFAWYLFVGHKIFFGEVSERAAVATADPPITISAILIALMILSLLAPLIGWVFVQHLGVGFFG